MTIEEKKEIAMETAINTIGNGRFTLFLNIEDYILEMRQRNLLEFKKVKDIIAKYEKGNVILSNNYDDNGFYLTEHYLLHTMQDCFFKIAEIDEKILLELLNNFYYFIN